MMCFRPDFESIEEDLDNGLMQLFNQWQQYQCYCGGFTVDYQTKEEWILSFLSSIKDRLEDLIK